MRRTPLHPIQASAAELLKGTNVKSVRSLQEDKLISASVNVLRHNAGSRKTNTVTYNPQTHIQMSQNLKIQWIMLFYNLTEDATVDFIQISGSKAFPPSHSGCFCIMWLSSVYEWDWRITCKVDIQTSAFCCISDLANTFCWINLLLKQHFNVIN